MITLAKRRLSTLDTARGFLMILVILYHLLYDFHLYAIGDFFWLFGWQGAVYRTFTAGFLMVISGMVSSLSKSNVKRGVKTFAFAMLLTMATFLFMPSFPVLFGILHYFGCMMLLSPLILKISRRVPVKYSVSVCILLFILTYSISKGSILGFNLPSFLYEVKFMFPLGFPYQGFISSDYYPLIPWGFLFAAGVFLGNHFNYIGFPDILYRFENKPLEFIGRHSLFIYLIHQPLFVGAILLIQNIF